MDFAFGQAENVPPENECRSMPPKIPTKRNLDATPSELRFSLHLRLVVMYRPDAYAGLEAEKFPTCRPDGYGGLEAEKFPTGSFLTVSD